jgi:mannose-6-phosphate isomerase-like protein (cupin superfamily)
MDMLPVDRAVAPCLQLGTDQITLLATAAQTGGALLAVEMRMPPGGGPPLMHRHDPGEVYHVIEGEFTFYVGGGEGDGAGIRRITAGPGDVVPLAGGVPHTVRNESGSDAVAFVVHAPGAPFENFVRAVAAMSASGSPDIDAVLAVAARNGIEMLGPIPDLAPQP